MIHVPSSEISLVRRILRFSLVRLILGLLVVGVPAGLVTMAIHALPLGQDVAGVLAAAGIAISGLLSYWLYVKYVEQRSVTELDTGFAARELGLGVLSGTTLFGVVVGVLFLLGSAHVVKVNSWYLMAGPFAMALSSGFYEELLLRGILFRIIERPLGTWISLTISALVFGAGHLANPGATLFTSAAIAVEAGVLLAGAYMMTRRLWVPIGIHFGWNFAQGGIFGIAVSGNPVVGWLTTSLEGPKLLSGGSFGAEASIVAVTLCTCTGGWFVWRSIRLGQIRPPMWAARRETVGPPGV